MLSHFTLASVLLFALAALADRHHRRTSQLINDVEQSASAASVSSSNWAGAGWSEDNETFAFVAGTFNAPVPSGPSGTTAAIWVGIDGTSSESCSTLFQAGVALSVNDNNEPSYAAWYEWRPDPPYYYRDFDINAGDNIRVSVTSFNQTSGLVRMKNLKSGQYKATPVTSTNPLCRKSAEWIVEDPSFLNGGLVPFADFNQVTFTDTKTSGSFGTRTAEGADISFIEQEDKILTYVSTDGSSLTITYV